MAKASVISINSGDHRARVLARRDWLITGTMPPGQKSLVERIAGSIHLTLPPSFDLDDLIGVGNLALIRAATMYNPAAHNHTPFSAYARVKIRGAILESVRRNRYLENTRPSIEGFWQTSNGAFPEDTGTMRNDPLDFIATQPVAELRAERNRLRKRLQNAASWLTPDQIAILQTYYSPAELTLAETGAVLGISKYKAGQRLAAAVAALRLRLSRSAA